MISMFMSATVRSVRAAVLEVTSLPFDVSEERTASGKVVAVFVSGNGRGLTTTIAAPEASSLSRAVWQGAQAVTSEFVTATVVDEAGKHHAWTSVRESFHRALVSPEIDETTAETRTPGSVGPLGATEALLDATVAFPSPSTAFVSFARGSRARLPSDLCQLVSGHFARTLFELGEDSPAPELVSAMDLLACRAIEDPYDAQACSRLDLGIRLEHGCDDATCTHTARLLRHPDGFMSVSTECDSDGDRMYAPRAVLALALAAFEELSTAVNRATMGRTVANMTAYYATQGPRAWCTEASILEVPSYAQAEALGSVQVSARL